MTNDDETKPALSIEQFSPSMQIVQGLAEKAKKVNTKDLEATHDTRIELRDARVAITKKGKELREGALKFQKDVIAKEKELLSVIAPDEERLLAAEEEIKLRREMETRRIELPTRYAALESIEDNVKVSDDELLAMDDDEFNAYRLRRIDAKLVHDREEFEQKKQKEINDKRIAEEAEATRRREALQKEEAEAAERRRIADEEIAAERRKLDQEKLAIEARQNAAREAEEARERELQRKEREAALEKEAEERKALAQQKIKEEREKEEAYQAFLTALNYDTKTDIIKVDNEGVKVYRLIGLYPVSKQ